MPDRDAIVRDVITSLSDGTPIYVLRRDIKSFYESIPIVPLKERLLRDKAIPRKVKLYLQRYLDTFCAGEYGLPRGIVLSALFAEWTMEPYDKAVRAIPGVYRYFRFCDDILVFCYEKSVELTSALNALPAGMSFSVEKTADYVLSSGPNVPDVVNIAYLGYEFSCSRVASSGKPRFIKVRISDRKIKRLKTRIVVSIRNFLRTNDYQLLVDRMRFLSGNYKVLRKGMNVVKRARFVKSGIYYSYQLCGEYRGALIAPHKCEELKEVDGFYQDFICGKNNKVGRVVCGRLAIQQLEGLRRISFKKGFEQRFFGKFTAVRVHQIKAVWRNV